MPSGSGLRDDGFDVACSESERKRDGERIEREETDGERQEREGIERERSQTERETERDI